MQAEQRFFKGKDAPNYQSSNLPIQLVLQSTRSPGFLRAKMVRFIKLTNEPGGASIKLANQTTQPNYGVLHPSK